MEVLLEKYRWIQRVLVDYTVLKKARVSYNFGSTINNKKFKCQLSDSDRFASFQNFTEDNKFLYRGVKVRNFISSFSRMK